MNTHLSITDTHTVCGKTQLMNVTLRGVHFKWGTCLFSDLPWLKKRDGAGQIWTWHAEHRFLSTLITKLTFVVNFRCLNEYRYTARHGKWAFHLKCKRMNVLTAITFTGKSSGLVDRMQQTGGRGKPRVLSSPPPMWLFYIAAVWHLKLRDFTPNSLLTTPTPQLVPQLCQGSAVLTHHSYATVQLYSRTTVMLRYSCTHAP
jgi:hypothetical protein